MSKIEAVIVSFNCLDLLSVTLPRNLPELDHIIIVTKPEDEETIEYCRSTDSDKLTIFTTDAFTVSGAVFNKGFAIAQAFNSCLKYNDWIVTQDTDIILHKGFNRDFINFNPDTERFYGMRRINIDTREEFESLEKGEKKLEDFICYRGSGYGYWACANVNSTIYKKLLKEWGGFGYPFWVKEARDIDWIWRNNWGERIFSPPLDKFPDCHFQSNNDYDIGLYTELPFRCLHLGIPGKNHEVRTTEKF